MTALAFCKPLVGWRWSCRWGLAHGPQGKWAGRDCCFAAHSSHRAKVLTENNVPQKLVVSGPYRYVRNPLYDTDMLLMAATALVTQNWAMWLLLLAYIAQLIMQLRMEERELRARFGKQYERFCQRVPRFLPRLTPVDPQEIYKN